MDFDVLKPRLVGPRVTLRPIALADAPAMAAAGTDPEARRLAGLTLTHSLADMEAHCQAVQEAFDRVDYAITRPDDDRFLGEATLNLIDWEHRSANFRIMLADASLYDAGLGSEASRLLIDHGFRGLRLHRIELEVFDFNQRARRVYGRLGFVLEGRRRDALRWNGRYHDSLVMSLLEEEWQFLQSTDERDP